MSKQGYNKIELNEKQQQFIFYFILFFGDIKKGGNLICEYKGTKLIDSKYCTCCEIVTLVTLNKT
jgi:hypothetical protein